MPAYSLPLFLFSFLDGRHVLSSGCCDVVLQPDVPTKRKGGAGKTDVHRPTAGPDGASFDSTDSKAAARSNVRTGLITGWGQGIDGGEGAQVCGLGPGSDFGRRR